MPLLLKRIVWVGTSSVLAVVAMVAFFAWLALQVQWRVPDPGALSGPTELLARDGTVIARFTSEVDRQIVDFDAMSEHVVDAVVANEDERFYGHDGVDPLSLLRAIATNLRTGGISQGGSTLTQQYVKNAFVGDERTLMRKVREAVISIQLERDLSKDEILERYLNTVYFGEGAYGVEAAALTYFGVPARDLTVHQAALLAQTLPAPSNRNPRTDPTGADQRADAIIDKMARLGMITPRQATQAQAAEVQVKPREPSETAAPYFVEYVRKQLEHAYGKQALLTGALTVRTSIDLAKQTELDAAVDAQLLSQDPGDVRAGAVAIDPDTGDILALHGGPDFSTQAFDLATQGRRQNGSTFKPLAFVAALEQGIAPTERYPSPGRTVITSSNCEPYEGAPEDIVGGPGGRMSLREGLINSVNTVFIRVGCDVGPEAILDVALRMGIRNRISPEVSVALGGSDFGASVLDMASAYATLANDGVYCSARSVLEVIGPDGQPRPSPREVTVVPGMEARPRSLTSVELEGRSERLVGLDDGRCVGVVDPDIARTATQALEEVVTRTTGTRAAIDRPQAGKTGTTNDEKDAWFAGYTPDLAMVVWVGDPGGEDGVASPMRDVAGFARVQGGTIPALIWKDAAEALLAEVSPTDFLEPGELVEGRGRRPAPARERRAPTPEADPSASPTPNEIPTGQGSSEPDDGSGPDQTEDDPEGGDPSGDPGGGDPGGGDPSGDDGCFLVLCDDDPSESPPPPGDDGGVGDPRSA